MQGPAGFFRSMLLAALSRRRRIRHDRSRHVVGQELGVTENEIRHFWREMYASRRAAAARQIKHGVLGGPEADT